MILQFGAHQTVSFSLVGTDENMIVSNYLPKVGMLTSIHLTFCPPQSFKAN